MEKKVFYSNSVKIAMQLYDIVLNFNATDPDGSADKEIKVFMSPQHAKVFASILQEHVQAYEDAFGPLPAMPDEKRIEELRKKGLMIEKEVD
jgi:hypothetical protein